MGLVIGLDSHAMKREAYSNNDHSQTAIPIRKQALLINMNTMRRMTKLCAALVVAYLFAAPISAVELKLRSPLEYQVVQRTTKSHGRITIAGDIVGGDQLPTTVEARLVANEPPGEWRTLESSFERFQFQSTLDAPTGGWYRVEIRISSATSVIAEMSIEHVGVGEVFVVAGQSNSANHGEEKQRPATDRVVTFDGQRWRISNDPQPGASGDGGSFIPPFGDVISQRFGVPVGFITCGIGATSVREWLPKGTKMANPPTLTGRVHKLADGEWESQGEAFEMLIARLKRMGLQGFRAVLWHQGESDANQRDPTRTLSGDLYREYLEKLIRDVRSETGWNVPWFVAQASYHVPGDESSPDIRAAQASLWHDGIALEGPDTDALKGRWRDSGGQGVHFSGPGLREHAALWVEKVAPWLEGQLVDAPDSNSAMKRLSISKILFLGNSITLHGPAPSIGWTGNWGMAASSEAADYVHLVTAKIAKATGTTPKIMVRNIADFERGYETFDVATKFKPELEFKADLVIVAIGENVADLSSDEARTKYAASFSRLLSTLQSEGRPTIFVRSSFWPNAAKDESMRSASVEAGVKFVDIAKLGLDPTNAASSERKIEHAGVAGHPGDKGMRAIADALFAAIQEDARSRK